MRKELRRWLRQLHEELKFTSVFVTHDQEEAMEVADRIVVMSRAISNRSGRRKRLCANRPAASCWSSWGSEPPERRNSRLPAVRRRAPVAAVVPADAPGSVDLFLRPWEMEVATESSERCPLPVQVLEVSPRGHFWQLTVQPIGWHQEPIGVVLPEGNPTPVRGGRYYVGSLNARLYAGDQLLQPVALAKSA